MKTKDIMTTMDVSQYLREIMKIPLYDEKTTYNSSSKREKTHCTATRTLGRFRSLNWREKSIKNEIRATTLRLCQLLKIHSDEYSAVVRERKKLRDLWLSLGKTQLEIRRLEKMCDNIENDFLRQIVHFRYFDNIEKDIPNWTFTAKELGIAVTGEELRRYVCKELMNLEKSKISQNNSSS